MAIAKLPIGIQDFGELITGGYVYVDKTEFIYKLITQGKYYFLSRPRRFGKSLLISTFEAVFLARRKLFKGLWIDDSDWTWQAHPVIRLDMSRINNRTVEMLEQGVISKLEAIAHAHRLELTGVTAADYLEDLIIKMAADNNVVVLIDEYDKPLVDQLDNDQNNIISYRNFLREFYSVLKSQDANIKFVFLTGVTKFSKVSVFSGLNNLHDLTMHDSSSTLLGYTRDELERYFEKDIALLAKSDNLTLSECYDKIKQWYNGYQFSRNGQQVFNPFSVLNLLDSKAYYSHWFVTGTPTFLVELIKKREFDLFNLERIEVSASSFESFEIENIPTLPLLYQSGYLTILEHDSQFDTYRLGYPNREVAQAFSESLIKYFATEPARTEGYLTQIYHNLDATPWNYDDFFELLERLLALIPYDLYLKEEKYYHSLFYIIFKLAGVRIGAEVHTQLGRVDCVIELKDKIILFEFKCNKTPTEAMKQIEENQYYQLFLDRNLPIYLVGINFNSHTRTLDGTLVKVLNVGKSSA